jgi:hypothetical protein
MQNSTVAATEQRAKSSQFLEAALLFALVAHIVAMGSMLLLLPGLPGGLNLDVAKRAADIAAHPWIWRIGWFPWQVTALSDLLLGLALVCTAWVRKGPAIFAILVTLAAMVPDQTGQISWTWIGPSVAARAVTTSDYAAYTQFESQAFLHIAGWATIGYIAGALGWTWCFVAAHIWSKRLTLISWVMWPIFITATSAVFLPEHFSRTRWIGAAVGIGNAVGFALLLLWLAEIAEIVLRRSRPDAASGRYAIFRHPRPGTIGRLYDLLGNSRLVQTYCKFIPMLAMESEITNVIYVNYLIEAARVEHFVDPPLRLQRLGRDGQYALFTFLTFHHGHFGPRCFGRVAAALAKSDSVELANPCVRSADRITWHPIFEHRRHRNPVRVSRPPAGGKRSDACSILRALLTGRRYVCPSN